MMSQSKETKEAIAEFWASITKHKPAQENTRMMLNLKNLAKAKDPMTYHKDLMAVITKHNKGDDGMSKPRLSQGLKDSLILIAMGVGTGILFGLALAYVLFFGGSMYGN